MRHLLPFVLAFALLTTACDGGKAGRSAKVKDDPLAKPVADCLAAHPDHAKTRVLLLGFDGADMDILDPMIEAGELPAFARMKKEGAFGKLRSITPMLSPVIWTTIATGKEPPVHGVIDFVVQDPESGKVVPTSSYARMAEAFWDIVGRYGSKVGVTGWLCTWPAEEVNGFLLSDRLGLLGFEYGRREDETRARRVWPPEIMEQVEPGIRKVGDITYEEVKGFVDIPEEEYRKAYTRQPQPGNLVGNFRLMYATAETFRRVGLSLWKKEAPRLHAVYYEFFDAVCHHFMPYAPPRMEHIAQADYEKYKGAVAEACRYTDRTLGEYMDAADENTVIIVVSDHGFRSGELRLKGKAEFHDRAAAQWHRRFGVFFAWGKNVRPGAKIGGTSVFDIAPTVLGLMGFPRADDMKGSYIGEAFTTPPPEESVATYERGRRERMEKPPEAGEEGDLLLKHLETLGYLGAEKSTSGHMNLGAWYMSQEKFEEALVEFQAALLKDQSSARIHLAIGEALIGLKRRVPAAKALRTAVALEPKLVAARLMLARLLHSLGKKEEALQQVAEAVAAEPENAEAQFTHALILLREKRHEEAEAVFRKTLEIEPDFPLARNHLGMLLLKQNRREEAEAQFQKVLDLEPGYLKAWNNLGVTRHRIALALEDPQQREEASDRAVATYDEIIKRFPAYPNAWFNRAVIRNLRGQREQALADLEKALAIQPDYAEALHLKKLLQKQ